MSEGTVDLLGCGLNQERGFWLRGLFLLSEKKNISYWLVGSDCCGPIYKFYFIIYLLLAKYWQAPVGVSQLWFKLS